MGAVGVPEGCRAYRRQLPLHLGEVVRGERTPAQRCRVLLDLGDGTGAGDRHRAVAARPDPPDRPLGEGTAVGGQRVADGGDPAQPLRGGPATAEPLQPGRPESAYVVAGQRRLRRVLAGEQPHPERSPGQAGQVVLVAGVEHGRGVAEHRQRVLHGGGAPGDLGERGGPVGPVGTPAVRPDQAVVHQVVERADERLSPGQRQVTEVQLVEVDVVGGQPAQRVGHRPAQVVRRGVLPGGLPGALVERVAELRGDHGLAAPPGERPAEHPLAVPGAVRVGGVEQRDAEVERAADRAYRLVVVDLAPAQRAGALGPGAADGPAPHTEGAHLDAAAPQLSLVDCHRRILSSSRRSRAGS